MLTKAHFKLGGGHHSPHIIPITIDTIPTNLMIPRKFDKNMCTNLLRSPPIRIHARQATATRRRWTTPGGLRRWANSAARAPSPASARRRCRMPTAASPEGGKIFWGCFLGNVWNKYMEHLWTCMDNIGKYVEQVWKLFEHLWKYMANMWNIYGQCVGNVWEIHGKTEICGTYMESIWEHTLVTWGWWEIYGILFELPYHLLPIVYQFTHITNWPLWVMILWMEEILNQFMVYPINRGGQITFCHNQ